MPAPGPDSLIDRVDGYDRRVGTVRRGEALTVAANFRTVHVFVVNRDGRLLLQRLAATRRRHPTRWGSSVAGYLHAGESYLSAARRRLGEELGLEVPLRELLKVEMEDEESTKFVSLFEAVAGSPINGEPTQIDALRYWDTAELDQAVIDHAEAFTPTFRLLYSAYRDGS